MEEEKRRREGEEKRRSKRISSSFKRRSCLDEAMKKRSSKFKLLLYEKGEQDGWMDGVNGRKAKTNREKREQDQALCFPADQRKAIKRVNLI